MTDLKIEIAGRSIGPGHPPYLIAELGINHGGDIAVARQMIDRAVEAGVDAVKLQTFRTEEFLAPSSQYFSVLKDAELPADGVRDLMAHAKARGVTLFSAAFDAQSVDLLAGLGAPAFKVASGDITHLPLLAHIARVGRPIILSTGASTIGEVDIALRTIRAANPEVGVALLHCVSNYPTVAGQANLSAMATMRGQFGVPVGFSDHVLGGAVAIAAVALGADIVEKHFTLDRSAPGPDHALSLDPEGMTALAAGMREAWQAVGVAAKAPVEAPDFIPMIRRSLNARVAIPAGGEIKAEMLAVRRPGTGIPARDTELVVGRRAKQDIAAGDTITWDMLAK